MKPKGIVLIVHGSGRTNAVAQQWYHQLRETIVKSGYSVYMWDKMGCGKSGGSFNYNQSVQNSADEVIAAINTLKQKNIPGSDNIGLWGISRAGWINPIVINKYKDIKFWISVSGVDDKENFKYLLEQNLRINKHSKETVDLIVKQWLEGTKITHSGGSFEAYQAATSELSKNKFWQRFTGGGISENGYYSYQKTFMKEKLDEETGLQLYIEDFDHILLNINCPVLAIFGEKDMNVDWKKTKSLYERTVGKNTDLTIKTFPDGNHNLFQCRTGGFYEMQDDKLPWKRSDGFFNTISNWLKERRMNAANIMKHIFLIILMAISACGPDSSIHSINNSEKLTIYNYHLLNDSSKLKITDENEPGEKLRLYLRFIDKESKQILKNQEVHFYHTSIDGEYKTRIPGDESSARLSGTAFTDSLGRILVQSILPGDYGSSEDNRHIHTTVKNAKPEGYDIHFKQYTRFMSKSFIEGSDQHFLADLKYNTDSTLVTFLTIEVKKPVIIE